MQLDTGHTGQNHITSERAAEFHRALFGNGMHVLGVGSQFAATLVSNNQIDIADGLGIFQGRVFGTPVNQVDSVSITNGTQGKKRKDLIVIHYEKSATDGVEEMTWKIYTGEDTTSENPSRPAHVEGDLRTGDMVAEIPMYEILLSGISVDSVIPLFDVASMQRQITGGTSAPSGGQDGDVYIQFTD